MKGLPLRFYTAFAALSAGVVAIFAADLIFRGLHRHPSDPVRQVAGGNAEQGRVLMERYGCGACHVIPGVRHAEGRVGPKLEDLHEQMFIAGRLANTPENLVRWIHDPQGVDPGNAMPDLGVTEAEARHMATWLYDQRPGQGMAGR